MQEVISYINKLTGKPFPIDNINKLRTKEEQVGLMLILMLMLMLMSLKQTHLRTVYD